MRVFRCALFLIAGLAGSASGGEGVFRRGETNQDGRIDISDGIAVLRYLFAGEGVACLDAADIDDSGRVDLADPIGLLSYLFASGEPPRAPFGDCGRDPTTDELDCATPPAYCTSGAIHVDSTPPGASIFLDGGGTGEVTPATLEGVAAGEHAVSVELPCYERCGASLIVRRGAVSYVMCQLTPKASIDVMSEPEGAQIFVDGRKLGPVTPATVCDVAEGRHEIRVELPGHLPCVEIVDLIERAKVQVSCRLEPLPGAIHASSDPPGARVLLDGAETGKVTPDVIEPVEAGEREIAFLLDGYETCVVQVMLGPGGRVSAHCALRPLGAIEVRSTPPGARILLDGGETGLRTPATLEGLAPGTYLITVAGPWHEPCARTVSIEGGEMRLVECVLEPLEGQLEPGRFHLAAEMATPRYYHTATPLEDGTVLVVGGSEERLLNALDTVEIFDQRVRDGDDRVGVFIDTDFEGDPMHLNEGPRIYHTATPLPNGKILVIGGAPDGLVGPAVSKVEIYDPLTRQFETLATEMKDARFRHTSVFMPSGKVMVFGGQISVEETVIDPNFPVNDPRFMQQINTYPSTRNIEIFDPTTLTFELARDLRDRPLMLQTQRGRSGHATVWIAGIDDALGGGVDIYVMVGGFQTLSPLFAPQTKLPRQGDLTNLTALEFYHPGQRVEQRAAGVGLRFGRVNDPIAVNLGLFRSTNMDGVAGVSNCFLVMGGDDNTPFGRIQSALEQEVFAATFTGQGPGDGIRFFRQDPDFGGSSAAGLVPSAPSSALYFNSHVFNVERLFCWAFAEDGSPTGGTQRGVFMEEHVTLEDGTAVPPGWLVEDEMMPVGAIDGPLPPLQPIETERPLAIGRSHTQGVVLKRLATVGGRATTITVPFTAGGVSFWPGPPQAYWIEEPVSAGSLFDPFYNLLNYGYLTDVHEGGWRMPTLLPYSTRFFSDQGNAVFNPAGIVGCFLVTDGNVPGNDWDGFEGLWPFPDAPEDYILYALTAARAWHTLSRIPGPDGIPDTADDWVLFSGGGGEDGIGKNGGMPLTPSAEIYVPPFPPI